jgi:hypothetical protein
MVAGIRNLVDIGSMKRRTEMRSMCRIAGWATSFDTCLLFGDLVDACISGQVGDFGNFIRCNFDDQHLTLLKYLIRINLF